MATSLERAEHATVALFESLDVRVFTRYQLQQIYAVQRWEWKIAGRYGLDDFLGFLVRQGHLKEIRLTSSTYKGFHLYAWGNASAFEVGLALRPKSYLSHGSAVFLHGLTDQLPAVVYSNKEQSPKRRGSGLSQARLDAAFARPQRRAKYLVEGNGMRILLLNGKCTDQLEVGPFEGPGGEMLRVAKLERTLIDIVVRPSYAGGVVQVLEAYKAAREHISVGLLVATLHKLDYVYPYHQAIGFFMERAGFNERLLARVERLGLDYDFYLAHGIKNPVKVPRWRLFVPEGL